MMGEPLGKIPKGTPSLFFRFPSRFEEWYYGPRLAVDGQFPYLGPEWRLFGPGADDISIRFDDDGRVSDIKVPD